MHEQNKKPDVADDLVNIADIDNKEAELHAAAKDVFRRFQAGEITRREYDRLLLERGEVETMAREASRRASTDRINGVQPSLGRRALGAIFGRRTQ